mmetsp:Transcript_31376/g.101409  ORF Transcript_31376/g.101409 Transcript_31376/m.101409 type:complete len:220 (-) Transcript_31376:6-665(-)
MTTLSSLSGSACAPTGDVAETLEPTRPPRPSVARGSAARRTDGVGTEKSTAPSRWAARMVAGRRTRRAPMTMSGTAGTVVTSTRARPSRCTTRTTATPTNTSGTAMTCMTTARPAPAPGATIEAGASMTTTTTTTTTTGTTTCTARRRSWPTGRTTRRSSSASRRSSASATATACPSARPAECACGWSRTREIGEGSLSGMRVSKADVTFQCVRFKNIL